MTDLLPCPFCGKPGAICELEDEPGSPMSFWVNCSCGIETPERRTEAEAIALWNKRAAPSRPVTAGCNCGVVCQDLGKEAGCRYLQPARETLRKLVDIVYQHATESTAVPATVTADLLIDRAFIGATLPPQVLCVEPRPIEEYHEDMGAVLWWKFPIEEAPYVGSPNDLGHQVVIRMPTVGHCVASVAGDFSPNAMPPKTIKHPGDVFFVGGWPGYHTHFTPLTAPPLPRADGGAK